jgi:hypothetical protein
MTSTVSRFGQGTLLLMLSLYGFVLPLHNDTIEPVSATAVSVSGKRDLGTRETGAGNGPVFSFALSRDKTKNGFRHKRCRSKLPSGAIVVWRA